MLTVWQAILVGLVPAVITGLVAWGGLRQELKGIRRDVDDLRTEVYGPPGKMGLRDKVTLLTQRGG